MRFPKNNKNTVNKSAVVRKFWAEGLTSPVAISAEAKKLGVNISPGYISLLTFIKKHKGPPKPRGKRRVAEPIVPYKGRGAKKEKGHAEQMSSSASLMILVGIVAFLANPFFPYWGLGISGAILIAGGVIAKAIIERSGEDSARERLR